jgi:DNA-binding PadR family transcriptional regulator
MKIRLVILGFLMQRPLYGYEIKSIIEERMGDWADIKFGSIYFALKTLFEKGFVTKKASEREAGRPERQVYAITDAGRKEFIRLLNKMWGSVSLPRYDFDLALFFISYLEKEEVRAYLAKRIAYTEEVIQHLDTHIKEIRANAYIPPVAQALIRHSEAHFSAEYEWLTELHDNLDRYYA